MKETETERRPSVRAAALLYCMACALHGESASASVLAELYAPETPDFGALLRLAKRHSVSALAYSALTDTDMTPETADAWRAASNLALRRALLMDAERREILSFLEASGIWYAPLKGVVLQNLYPRYGLREMSDNDILYDPDGLETVRTFLLSRGYRQETPAGRGKDIAYFRPPLYHFEMHTALFEPSELSRAYGDVTPRLRKDPGGAFARRFSDEDFYAYLIAHAFHHFQYGGTGFRTLADIFAFRTAIGADGDAVCPPWASDVPGLPEFERRMERLSRELFSRPPETVPRLRGLSGGDLAALARLEASGTHGTRAQTVRNAMERLRADNGKPSPVPLWKYALSRLRSDAERYDRRKTRCPAALYPFYLFFHVARDALRGRKHIFRDLRTARKIASGGNSAPPDE